MRPLPLLLALLAAAPAARAEAPACRGRLSGAVEATFECNVRVREVDDVNSVFELFASKPIDGIPSVVPGSFLVARPIKPGTLTLETIGLGRATVAKEGGTLYIASKTQSTRGEVTLTITSVEPAGRGFHLIHGTYRARLLPAGAGKSGEVIVEATF